MRFFGQNEWRNGPRTRFFRFYQNLIHKSFVFYMMLQQHGGLQLIQVSCEKSVSGFFDKKVPKMSFFYVCNKLIHLILCIFFLEIGYWVVSWAKRLQNGPRMRFCQFHGEKKHAGPNPGRITSQLQDQVSQSSLVFFYFSVNTHIICCKQKGKINVQIHIYKGSKRSEI